MYCTTEVFKCMRWAASDSIIIIISISVGLLLLHWFIGKVLYTHYALMCAIKICMIFFLLKEKTIAPLAKFYHICADKHVSNFIFGFLLLLNH